MQHTIDDSVEGAKDELKRADHSIYVTLKYTRTVDVIKNIIKRLIAATDIAIADSLNHLHAKKKLKEVPLMPKKRALLVSTLLPQFKKDIDFYFLLREIDIVEYTKREEYRKNVSLIVTIKGKTLVIDIETIKKYFERTVDLVDRVHALATL